MNRFVYNKRSKRKFILVTAAIILVLFMGIGYSSFSQMLSIDGTITYNFEDIDIGFSQAQDLGSTFKSSRVLSEDGKSMTVKCTFSNQDKQDICVVKATIVNNTTEPINLLTDPIITYDDTYIHTVTFKWNNHPTYENHAVYKDNFIAAGSSEEVILTVKSKFIDENVDSSLLKSIPITITLDYGVWDKGTLPKKEDLAVLMSTGCYLPGYDVNSISTMQLNDFENVVCSEMMNNFMSVTTKVINLTIERGIDIPEEALFSVDISSLQNGKVYGYALINEEHTTENDIFYDFYIQSDTQLYANEDMSFYFASYVVLERIYGLELLDTSMTTDMKFAFANFDAGSPMVSLDLSGFDTSEVIDMTGMFFGLVGSTNFSLNISSLDTSNVIGMSMMFYTTGVNCVNFNLDVSNFDTSNVINMFAMFYNMGSDSTSLTLDVSNFDTSEVIDMTGMFFGTGDSSTNFTLDVSGFDTINVTDMSWMFFGTGYSSASFTLDVSGFDTSKVTDMSFMFYGTGYSSTIFTLDVSNFDTSIVTNMQSMFYQAGYSNPSFTLDVSGFDTSNVTNMSYMFNQTGYNSTSFVTEFTIRNPNASYSSMFTGVATKEGSKMTVHYNYANKDRIDNIINTKTSGANVVKGDLIFDVGDEVNIGDEKFNVISQDDDTITLLAKKNLDSTYKQNDTENYVFFADNNGWEYTPGPKEIEVLTWSPNVNAYLVGYTEYLKTITNDDTLTSDLITLKQLKSLGCTINDDYSSGDDLGCSDSKYIDWIANGQSWYTRSAVSDLDSDIWSVRY